MTSPYIPKDVWEIAREILGEPDTVTRPKNIERAARVLLAYGQIRADEARESAAQVAVEAFNQAAVSIRNEAGFPERQYPWRLVQEKAGFIANGIRSQK